MTDEILTLEEVKAEQFPFSLDLQYFVVIRMCRDFKFLIAMIPVMNAKCFENVYFQIITNIAIHYYQNYRTLIPSQYLWDMCGQYVAKDQRLDLSIFQQIVTTIYQTPIEDSDEYLLERTKRFLLTRNLEKVLKKSLQELEDLGTETEISKIAAEVKKACTDQQSSSLTLFNHQTSLNDRIKKLQMPRESVRTVVAPELDRVTEGGLGKGELMVVIAPTGKGKTLFLINFAKGALICKLNVLYVTLETSAEIICQRLDSSMTGMSKQQIRQDSDKAISLINQHYATCGGGCLYVAQYPPGTASVETIEYLMNDLETGYQFKPDVVFVDYADLCRPSYRQTDRRFELTQIYTSLRSLGVIYKIPVFTASQSNRSSFTEELVDLQHMAEDIGKAQIADIIISLCQTPSERENIPEILRLYIAKSRNSQAQFTIPVEVYKNTMQIRPPTNPEGLPVPSFHRKGGGDNRANPLAGQRKQLPT